MYYTIILYIKYNILLFYSPVLYVPSTRRLYYSTILYPILPSVVSSVVVALPPLLIPHFFIIVELATLRSSAIADGF